MVILAPAKSSTSWPRIAQAGAFCVNILGEHQEALCRDLRRLGRRQVRRGGWTPGVTGAPVHQGLAGRHRVHARGHLTTAATTSWSPATWWPLEVGEGIAAAVLPLGLRPLRCLSGQRCYRSGRCQRSDPLLHHRRRPRWCAPMSTATSEDASSRPTGAVGFPLGREMVQGNRSEKQAGALVGLHYPPASGRLLVPAARPGPGGAARPAPGSPPTARPR